MDLSDDEVQQCRSRSPRGRSADPVESATWAKAGQLDWWVKERQEWLGRVRGATAVNGGSELLIFVPRAARGSLGQSEDCFFDCYKSISIFVPKTVLHDQYRYQSSFSNSATLCR